MRLGIRSFVALVGSTSPCCLNTVIKNSSDLRVAMTLSPLVVLDTLRSMYPLGLTGDCANAIWHADRVELAAIETTEKRFITANSGSVFKSKTNRGSANAS